MRALLLAFAPLVACDRGAPPPAVAPSVETGPVRSAGDAADDPAIWLHPADPARSLVIGTDRRGGLGVWDLEGREVQFLTGVPTDNVDIRTADGPGGAQAVVVASGWDDRQLHAYTVDPASGRLTAAGTVRTGVAAAGLCLYRSAVSGRVHAFAMSEAGSIEQWELAVSPGGVQGRLVRGPWDVGGETEGCVADDAAGRLYVGEESRGVWRYDAEPDRPAGARTAVDDARSGRLEPDVEGLAVSTGPGDGHLFVSSQGDSTFAAYERTGANRFVGRFRVGDAGGGGPDGCEDTDGIEVLAVPLGPAFPHGVFVCQDGRNDDDRQNYKLVPLERVTTALGITGAI